ncbi:Asparagine synthetase B [glutamine-hydrolyzing] [Candidatus Calditenuaceae archaeon HR02]|nr:Asparagine synthetase B [glutamine-hydrolyzing] [Candidatus Calditenuaceae archaeon HR02]
MAIVYAVVSRCDVFLSSLIDRVLRMSYRWPVNEVFIDGSRISPRELSEAKGRVGLVVHHAGERVVEEGRDGIAVHLTPSSILGVGELADSPFTSEIEIRREVVRLKSRQVGSPPLSYYSSGEIITVASPPYIVGLHPGPEKVVPPCSEMLLRFNGPKTGEKQECTSSRTALPINLQDVSELLFEELVAAVKRSVAKKCAVLFSGGIDSSLLVWVCVELGLAPLAISVGLGGSHDLSFSEKAAKLLHIDYVKVPLSEQEIAYTSSYLTKNLILQSLMDRALALLVYEGARAAASHGRRQVVSGQGADELFGGYMKYLRMLESGNQPGVEEEMRRDLDTLWFRSLPRDYASAALGGCLLTTPYLDERIINNAYNLPLNFKISRGVRKVVLRSVARLAGLPSELVEKEKKAAQYGTGIEKALKRIGTRTG